MNRTLSYGAKLFAHLDPSKGVDAYRQQDGGHGSRNPLRSVDGMDVRRGTTTYIYTHSRAPWLPQPRQQQSASCHRRRVQARQSHCGNSLIVPCIRSSTQRGRVALLQPIVVSSQLQFVHPQRNPQLLLALCRAGCSPQTRWLSVDSVHTTRRVSL